MKDIRLSSAKTGTVLISELLKIIVSCRLDMLRCQPNVLIFRFRELIIITKWRKIFALFVRLTNQRSSLVELSFLIGFFFPERDLYLHSACAPGFRMRDQIEIIDSFLSGHLLTAPCGPCLKKGSLTSFPTLLQVQGLCRQQVPASPRAV